MGKVIIENLFGIVAVSNNLCIGRDGGLPFKMRSDLQWFKQQTMGSNLIVGRKTFETLPPLIGRNVYVLSKSPNKGYDLAKMLRIVANTPNEKFYVAGGAEVYSVMDKFISQWFVTMVDADVDGDTFLDEFPKGKYRDVKSIEKNEHNEYNAKIMNVWRAK